jgi:subtilisin
MPPRNRNGRQSSGNSAVVTVGPRQQPYLVARQDALLPAGVDPTSIDDLLTDLEGDPEVHVERVIAPQSLAVAANTPGALQRVIVARMSTERAEELGRHPQVLIERDAVIRPVPAPTPVLPDLQDPGVFIPFGGSTHWRIRVSGPGGVPVASATVYLYGAGVPAQGQTDKDGLVELSLVNETDETIRAIFVNPQDSYWTLWLNDPRLTSGSENSVVLTPLADSFPGFPQAQLAGWGQRTMRIDRLAAHQTGAGVKVAVIDSGAAITHPELDGIHYGEDYTVSPPDDETWVNDAIAHGSHCSGVIMAKNDVSGIRGIAPDVEIHELRVFPGGRFSSLLDALDYCIDRQIDVVNLSLGSGSTSSLLLSKLAQAKQAGVACVVAAGNSGGPVQFPGSSPDVLTVAAIGKIGEFPPDSYHAQQIPLDGPTDNGYFAGKFSCHGPEVDVCAPGVAIVSTVPPQGYAAWDGTSMATPHVTGLAALVLAHHADFAGAFRTPNAARVDRLFQILKNSATTLNLGDPERTGAGVPDALKALGVGTGQSGPAGPPGVPSGVQAILDELKQTFVAAGLL